MSERGEREYREVITNFVEWCGQKNLYINASKKAEEKEMVIDFCRNVSQIAQVNTQGLDIEIMGDYK